MKLFNDTLCNFFNFSYCCAMIELKEKCWKCRKCFIFGYFSVMIENMQSYCSGPRMSAGVYVHWRLILCGLSLSLLMMMMMILGPSTGPSKFVNQLHLLGISMRWPSGVNQKAKPQATNFSVVEAVLPSSPSPFPFQPPPRFSRWPWLQPRSFLHHKRIVNFYDVFFDKVSLKAQKGSKRKQLCVAVRLSISSLTPERLKKIYT